MCTNGQFDTMCTNGQFDVFQIEIEIQIQIHDANEKLDLLVMVCKAS